MEKESKRTNNNKKKGNSFEREISSYLSKVYNESFVRVSNSGSFIGGKNAFRKKTLSENQKRNAKSDIVPPDNMKYLVIEAKSYSELGFHQIIQGECLQLDGWINQVFETIDDDDLWFVIFKIVRKGKYIVYDNKLSEKFAVESYAKYKSYIVTDMETFFDKNRDIVKSLAENGIK